jgi:hypothetical protein
MMQIVQLALGDSAYQAALRDALLRSGPWHIESVDRPDLSERCVLVVDEESLSRTPLPLPYPERVVLIVRTGDHDILAQAWEAGIVSVVSANDPPATVLLAIMAAALRVPKVQPEPAFSAISPSRPAGPAPISPSHHVSPTKRCKTQ